MVGGATGTTNYAFKNASDPLTALPGSYVYKSHRTVPVATRFDWVPGTRHSEPGKGLLSRFCVHY
eukprot:SAG31_NODE_260_length_18915_cov_3.432823_9_plen_65_part_00